MGVFSLVPLQARSATPSLECSPGTEPFRYGVSIVNPDRSFTNQPEIEAECRAPQQPLGDELCPTGHRLVTFMRNSGGGIRILCEPTSSSASPTVGAATRPPLVPPPVLAHSPLQLAAARREREGALSDRGLLASYYDTFRNGRTSSYRNMALALLRIGYYMEGRQTDTVSIRGPLLEWLRLSREGRDPVFRTGLQNLLGALRGFRESYNQERAQTILRLMEETERLLPPSRTTPTPTPTSPADVSPQTVPTPVAPAVSPPQAPTPNLSPTPQVVAPPHEIQTPEPTPMTPIIPTAPRVEPRPLPPARVRPVSFTAGDREVRDINALLLDIRGRAIPASRAVTDRYTRRTGQALDLTVRVRITYNSETSGQVTALSYPPTQAALVQEILQAIARDLPRFRGHPHDSVEIPLVFRYGG